MTLPLKKLREEKGITQAELSKFLNISPSTVGMWEQGRREPDYVNLKKIANIFHVSIDYLLDNEHPKKNLESEETKLLNGFQSLNREGQNIILGMLNSLRVTHSGLNGFGV